MKTVIYHSGDYDGICCREIARKFLGDEDVNYIGWDFGEPALAAPTGGETIVMDLPLDKPFGRTARDFSIGETVVWIDHHQTSIASHPQTIPGYRIDGVAACRLAWQWFARPAANGDQSASWALPDKPAFIDRQVCEPLVVQLLGEYDVWDKRDARAETLQYALRATEVAWPALLDCRNLDVLLEQGSIAQRYQENIDADLVRHRSYQLNWEGLNWIVLNTGRFNSLTFKALDVPETGHDALMGYMFNGRQWVVSLYHARNRTDLDLSKIAEKNGGGGHRGACGFTCKVLPW